jgi:endo-1,4-beta-xylanase
MAASAAIAACAPVAYAEAPTSGLASLAAQRGLVFGAAVQIEQLNAEGDLCAAVMRECSGLTPEVALNWAAMEPARGELSLVRMDDLASLALDAGKRVHGHTLLWHRAVPDWARAALRDERDWRLVRRFFGSIVPRYGEVIDRWDVVNEPIDVGQRSDGLRDSIFLEVFGPDYIRHALEQARAFAPHAQLYINEYSLEYDFPEERERRRLFLKLIEGLKSAGAPLDGVGLQSHLDLGKGSISEPAVRAFMRDLDQMGLSVAITELDVKEADYAAPPETRDTLVGDEVRRYLDIVLASPRVVGLTTWGLSDRHSWLEVTAADEARFPGAWADGEGPGLNRGLPFDAAMRPKPMYRAIEQALLGAPRRAVRRAPVQNPA